MNPKKLWEKMKGDAGNEAIFHYIIWHLEGQKRLRNSKNYHRNRYEPVSYDAVSYDAATKMKVSAVPKANNGTAHDR